MQLCEQGKIDLDDLTSKYIDTSKWFVNPADGKEITIRDLMNQTSGIDCYQTFGKLKKTDSYGTHIYANANYGLLGLIIEAVSGMTYEDYVTKNIFNPLSMDNSAATLQKAKANGLIAGYRNYFGVPVDNGSYYYGMGWMYSETMYSQPIFLRSGLVENYTSNMFILQEEGIEVAVLVNMNDYLVNNKLLSNILNPLIGEARTDASDLYLILHGAIDFICILLCVLSVYGFVRAFRFKYKKRNLKVTIFDVCIYVLVPLVLLSVPFIINTPISIMWLFVKDLCMVIYINTVMLIVAGICRLVFLRKEIMI